MMIGFIIILFIKYNKANNDISMNNERLLKKSVELNMKGVLIHSKLIFLT